MNLTKSIIANGTHCCDGLYPAAAYYLDVAITTSLIIDVVIVAISVARIISLTVVIIARVDKLIMASTFLIVTAQQPFLSRSWHVVFFSSPVLMLIVSMQYDSDSGLSFVLTSGVLKQRC